MPESPTSPVILAACWMVGTLTSLLLLAVAAHFSFAKAFSHADARAVIPMDFMRLPLAALVGYMFYAEGMEIPVILGALIIFGGNLVNIHAEKNLLGKPDKEKSP